MAEVCGLGVEPLVDWLADELLEPLPDPAVLVEVLLVFGALDALLLAAGCCDAGGEALGPVKPGMAKDILVLLMRRDTRDPIVAQKFTCRVTLVFQEPDRFYSVILR